MPELPEVETTIRKLKSKIIKRKIVNLWTDFPKIIRGNIDKFLKEIKNRKIENIFRRGKNIIFELENNRAFLIHLKLTGHLLFGKWRKENEKWQPTEKGPLEEPINRFIHLILFLDNKEMFALSDLRKFAKLVFGTKKEILDSPEIKKLGPEPLEKNFSFDDFDKRLGLKRGKIKQILMDQEIIAGIGNIYSDEILWEAKIHPLRETQNLNKEDKKRIFRAMKKILKKAIELGGESISDYRDPEGEKGRFDKLRKVYRREGEKCSSCGTIIKRIKIRNRSSYFCARCQV